MYRIMYTTHAYPRRDLLISILGGFLPYLVVESP